MTPALSTPLTPQGFITDSGRREEKKKEINGQPAAVEAGRGRKEDGGGGAGEGGRGEGEGEEEEDKSIIIQEA